MLRSTKVPFLVINSLLTFIPSLKAIVCLFDKKYSMEIIILVTCLPDKIIVIIEEGTDYVDF